MFLVDDDHVTLDSNEAIECALSSSTAAVAEVSLPFEHNGDHLFDGRADELLILFLFSE